MIVPIVTGADATWRNPTPDEVALVLLHLDDDGYLHELELVQNPGGSSGFGELDPSTMWVFAPPWRPGG